jgi:hypothetical protein
MWLSMMKYLILVFLLSISACSADIEDLCLSCSESRIEQDVFELIQEFETVDQFVNAKCLNLESKVETWFDLSSKKTLTYFVSRYKIMSSIVVDNKFGKECYLGRYKKFWLYYVDVSLVLIKNKNGKIAHVFSVKEADLF